MRSSYLIRKDIANRVGASGQTAVEHAILTAIVVGALIGMQIYMKRGMSGVHRAAADSLGEQYDARDTDGAFTTRVTGTTKTSVQFLKDKPLGDGNTADVLVTTVTIDPDDPETTSRTGNETVGPATGNLWN